jgi:hypothetical protein
MAHAPPIHVAHALQIGVPNTLSLVVGMADVVANHGDFTAKLTLFGHDYNSFQSITIPGKAQLMVADRPCADSFGFSLIRCSTQGIDPGGQRIGRNFIEDHCASSMPLALVNLAL